MVNFRNNLNSDSYFRFMSDLDEFDQYWRAKFKSCLENASEKDLDTKIFQENDHELAFVQNDPVKWSSVIVERLEKHANGSQIHDILTNCACQYNKDNLKTIKEHFQQSKDLKSTHFILQQQFREFIKPYKNLTDEMVDELLAKGWGVAGVLDIEKNQITATKIPKAFHEYFAEIDSQIKRHHYCHCPRVRFSLKEGKPELSSTYCLCGAGFYRGIWEEIIGSPVSVEISKSVLDGNDVCEIIIHLPPKKT